MKYILLLATCMVTISLQAQNLPDKFNFNVGITLPGDVNSKPGNSWGYQRSEISVYKKPKNLMKKTLVFHGFGYINNNFTFPDRTSALNGISTNYHDARYTIIVSSRLKNPRWSWLNAARVTLRSDFKNKFVPGQEIYPFFQSVAQYSWRKDGRFKTGIGISLNNDLGYYIIAPTAMVNYRSKNNKFALDLVYPNLNIVFKPTKRFEWGVISNIEGGIYRMRPLTTPTERAAHFRHLQLATSPMLSYRLNPKKNYWLNFRAGYTFLRRIELLNNDYKAIRNFTLDADNNMLLRVGLVQRFM